MTRSDDDRAVAPPAGLDDRYRDAYLRRLGLEHVPPADEASLRDLHRRHVTRIPFENYDVMLGRRIDLEPDLLVDKFAVRGRGGFCYELNGAFASLLATLGYQVRLAEARVFVEGGLGVRFDHLCLLVTLEGRHLLADVGFGEAFDEPLSLESGVLQRDTAGEFRLTEHEDGWWDVEMDGRPQFRFLRRPRRLTDFEPGLRYHSTPGASHFTERGICTIRTSEGRVTLRGTLLTETTNGARTKRSVSPPDLADVVRERFGIDLDAGEAARLIGELPVS